MKTIIKFTVSVLFLTGCLGTAKLANFSHSASTIDFDKLSKEFRLAGYEKSVNPVTAAVAVFTIGSMIYPPDV